MSTTASGFFYPATGYTSGEFQELKDMADSQESVITATRNIRTFKVADSAALNALSGSYTLREGLDFARRDDNEITYRYNGSAWKAWESDWIAYTPTFTNFTIGTGGSASNTAFYKYAAGDVRMYGSAVLGTSGASVGTTVSFTIPVTAQTPVTNYYYGTTGIMIDSGTTERNLFIRANGTSATSAQLLNANSTTGLPQGVTATSPWTWAAGDSVNYEFTYRPA